MRRQSGRATMAQLRTAVWSSTPRAGCDSRGAARSRTALRRTVPRSRQRTSRERPRHCRRRDQRLSHVGLHVPGTQDRTPTSSKGRRSAHAACHGHAHRDGPAENSRAPRRQPRLPPPPPGDSGGRRTSGSPSHHLVVADGVASLSLREAPVRSMSSVRSSLYDWPPWPRAASPMIGMQRKPAHEHLVVYLCWGPGRHFAHRIAIATLIACPVSATSWFG